jgi:CubicO group peptidase (beta-lactamase class C family)
MPHVRRLRLRIAVLALVLLAALRCSMLRAQDDAAAMQAEVEGAQAGGSGDLAGLTLADAMQQVHVPGVGIAVIRDFAIHWAKGYGVADVEAKQAVSVDTLFQAASISKPITAMAAMRLVQEGRLALDEDVNKILTSWKVPTSTAWQTRVTPRALMSHTSGADDGFGFPGYDPDAPRPTLVQILNGDAPSNVGKVLFARPPYQAYKYSGGAVTLMQLALGDLTHQPFAAFMRASILGPLAMNDSTYEQPIPEPMASRTARGHSREGEARPVKWHVYPEQAAAGLWTTPSDLARAAIDVQKALRGAKGAVLTQASAREMITPVGVGPFAVGFTIEKRGEGWYFSHGGSNWGFQCLLLAHVRKGYGVAVMTNADSGGRLLGEVVARVAAAYKWDTLDQPLPR